MSINQDKAYWIWLASIPGIGARRFHSLIEYFNGPKQVWEASPKEITSTSMGDNIMNNILNYRKNEYLDKAYEILDMPSIRVITMIENKYPPLLKEIYDPPPLLYCKGNELDYSKPAISIVGSRSPTGYGRQMAEKLAFELATAGFTVVSGLARGIDAMAHFGALKARGSTVGVLGCGIDKVYPPENGRLFSRMEQEGSILSEYSPGTLPLSGNFPARNRIISGMTQGVLVIEAGNKSGALITVDFALEQGRDVYALPGNINTPQSIGTNRILKQGAKLITCLEDILEEFEVNVGAAKVNHQSLQLDFFETQVYNALEEGEKHLEDLVKVTKMGVSRLNAVLTMLEIRGIVKQMPGKIFIRNWDAVN